MKLVISDAHEGLKAAIIRVMGATRQRCRVHWMRNALAYVTKGQNSMAAAALRQAFLHPNRTYTNLQFATKGGLNFGHLKRSTILHHLDGRDP